MGIRRYPDKPGRSAVLALVLAAILLMAGTDHADALIYTDALNVSSTVEAACLTAAAGRDVGHLPRHGDRHARVLSTATRLVMM